MKPPKETPSSKLMADWWKCPGVVYFFAAGNPPIAIKIGVTAVTKGNLQQAIHRRFRQIQSSNHETIELLGVICFSVGEYPTRLAEVRERELQNRFASLLRFKQHSLAAEWFAPSAELLDYIRENAEPPEALSLRRIIAQSVNR